jgi:hypothetical protein
VIFLQIATFPPSKGSEVGKAGMKAMQMPQPDYVKTIGQWVTCAGELGTKFYNIYEVDKDKIEEGFKWIQSSSIPFESIEGMRTKVEILTPVEEAMAMIGMALP